MTFMKTSLISNLLHRKYWSRLILTSILITTGVSPAVAQSTTPTDSEYINSILPEAQRIQQEYGIPLDLTLAIARLESGNGDHVIGKNNHFGLRCASDDCVSIEKNGRMISYETCPDATECFNIFAESVKELTGDKPITITRLAQNGFASGARWDEKVVTIRREVRQTLTEAGIDY